MEIEPLTIAIGIPVLALMLWGICSIANGNRRKVKRDSWYRAEYKRWIKNVAPDGTLTVNPIDSHAFALAKNELMMRIENQVQLVEGRAVRNTAYGGLSIPIGCGIRIKSGGARGESHEEMRLISTGTLAITNMRLIFIGDFQNRDVPFSKITAMQYTDSELHITSSSRQKTMYFCGLNGRICLTLITSLRTAVANCV